MSYKNPGSEITLKIMGVRQRDEEMNDKERRKKNILWTMKERKKNCKTKQ